MKILIFNWRDIKNPKAGGAEVYTHEITRRLVKKGHQVTLFTSSFVNSPNRENKDGVEIVRDGGRFGVYWKARKHYKRHFRNNFDVVVDQVNTMPFFTPLYVSEPKIALIFQLTGAVYLDVLPKPLGSIAAALEPYFFKAYSRSKVVVLSESVKEELVKLNFSSDNVTVVHPGIEHGDFGLGDKSQTPSVLFLNRVVKYKNVDHLIRAFKAVKEKIPEARLVIAGCRGDSYEEGLKSMVKSLNMNSDVEFLPFSTGEKKKKLLQQAWIHVLPSTKEGWGISVLEAAACGTPSVAYNVAGLKNSVKNGVTGILVAHGDIEGLAGSMTQLLSDKTLREQFSSNCLDYSRSFSWDISAEKFLGVLEEVRLPSKS
jgi:glycosyltransferase involved in cell wall biosynthesis